MGMSINTNVASLNAQRNLSGSANSLATSMQRLSSGLRVNSAKDDAAGLAISERMNAQVRGMNVAARNANDGISLAQTAEGALGKVADMLQRVRELAVQSANATNSDSDRASLQAEANQLKEEIERTANTTAFNGKKLLDGSSGSQAFQVGANQGETITTSSIASAKIGALGTWNNVATASQTVAVGTITAGSVSGTTTTDYVYTLAVDGNTLFTSTVTAGNTSASIVTGAALDAAWSAFSTANPGYSLTGTFAAGTAQISKTDGTSIVIASSATGGAGGTIVAPAYAGTGFVGTTSNGVASTLQTGFSTLDISTVEGANNAILAMDGALTAVNSSRSDLGALQSRFENAIGTLQVNSENTAAARGRIVDADFAQETANLSRSQILQQAGTAMVAQANQLPQQVLQLLR